MSDARENAAQKIQDPASPPTEAPASEGKKPDESQGGLKEVGLEELLERAKMDATLEGAKEDQAEAPKQDASKTESGKNEDLSILEKARQILEQEKGQEQPNKADTSKDAPDEALGGQEPEKVATQIGDTPGAEKVPDDAGKKDAEAKEEGKGPGDVQPAAQEVTEADDKAKEGA